MKRGDLIQIRKGYGRLQYTPDGPLIYEGDIGFVIETDDGPDDAPYDETFIRCCVRESTKCWFESYELKVIEEYEPKVIT